MNVRVVLFSFVHLVLTLIFVYLIQKVLTFDPYPSNSGAKYPRQAAAGYLTPRYDASGDPFAMDHVSAALNDSHRGYTNGSADRVREWYGGR